MATGTRWVLLPVANRVPSFFIVIDKESYMKYQLLKNDFIEVAHPKTKKIHRLYKIIALRSFSDVVEGDVGGYIENETNLSHDGDCWVANLGKVFNMAVVKDNSLVVDDGAVFDNAVLSGNSLVGNYARLYEQGNATDTVITGVANVHGKSRLLRCTVMNSAKVYQDANCISTMLTGGSMAHGQAELYGCSLSDISEVRGTAKLTNCTLSGRAIIEDGVHENETIAKDIELNVTIGR